ncbi:MAG TPA: FMN-binding negative transcriptional regulator [Flavobacterium sp.]|jgi:transcriptional regulator
MYIPEIYKNEHPENIREFIRNNSFAILVSTVDGKPWATHIPIELEINAEGKEVLCGHISIENPQWKAFNPNEEVLAIFQGPHSYISSSWYDHENVPTWNYIAVHVYGRIKILEGDAVFAHLKKLVDKYEAASENPVSVENFSEQTMLQARGIVVFEIVITAIQAKRKLSQNRDDVNYKNIISELEKKDDPNAGAIAAEMKKCPR